jgi:hypothetical protein
MPTPSTWGKPSAVLRNTKCNITQHFRDHVIIFGEVLIPSAFCTLN